MVAVDCKLENTIWDVPSNWSIKEDYLNEGQQKNIVDGKNILAVVEGIFFVPNGISRNERYYPKTFWNNILEKEEIKTRLSDKVMFGEIGHNDRPVSEIDLTEGRVSHVVTNLWIDEEGKGMGQVYVLGTPAGRNLYTYMKAGCKIKTSSRASGDFKANEKHDGMPIVDEDNYYLETFDFVINPGFLETNPKLMENVNKIKKEMERKKEMEYGKELFERLEKSEKELIKKNEQLIKDLALAENENQESAKKIEDLENKVEEFSKSEDLSESFKKEISQFKEENQESSKKLKEYEEIGEAKEIKQILDESVTRLETYVRLGKPEDIKKELSESKNTIKEYSVFGTIEELEETLPAVEKVLEEYHKLGTLSEIKETIERARELTKKIKLEKFEDSVIKISREYKTPIENVKKLLESVGEIETVNILKSVMHGNKKVISEEEKGTKTKKPLSRKPIPENTNEPVVKGLFKTLKMGR